MPDIALSPTQEAMLIQLTPEERQVVLDQMIERIREELEWSLALAAARKRPPRAPLADTRRRGR